VEKEDADGRKTQWDHDHFWRLTKELDGLGHVTEQRYEILEGLKAGLLGNLINPTEIRSPTFTQQQQFDRRGRLTSRSLIYRNADGEQTSTNSRTYDKRGRMTSETDANGKISRYAYNALDSVVTGYMLFY
jgi:YD repeat-containing protein